MKKEKQNKQKLQEEGPAGAPLSLPPGTVRVRMLKRVNTMVGLFEVGAVVNIPAVVANSWLKAGIAEQDKALDGPAETK